MKKYNLKSKKILSIIVFLVMLFLIVICLTLKPKTSIYKIKETKTSVAKKLEENNYGIQQLNNDESKFIYLSDIPYESAKTAWGSILMDKTSSNTLISMYVDNNLVTFKKGIWAHATSTLIYNLSNYDYDYFSTYYGICTTSGNNGNGVKFYIYTSKDGTNWQLQTPENPIAIKSSNNAQFITINIKDVKYLKLYAHDNGANGNDHAVYADSKLFKEGYNDNIVKTVEEYDNLISKKYNVNSGTINEELELLILQRDFVKNVGQYQLKTFFEDAKENGKLRESEETFNWLFNNVEILRLFITGGKPDGTYLKSLQVLTDLYSTYKEDLNVIEKSPNGENLSDIYLKMIISLSLTHSRTVNFWINSSAAEAVEVNPNVSQATNRYKIYKDMLAKNKLNAYFEQLEVEEMRLVMNSMVCDDEIEWLRDYIISSGKNWRSSYQFMSYKNVNTALYRSDTYYGENRANWNDKFKLDGYDIANVKYYPKTFIVMQVGGVCWQISNVGQTMCASYGVPSVAVGQPGHVAYFVYDLDKNKNATWSIWNNVGGWQVANLNNYTGNRGSYKVRLLNGWGSQSFASGNCGSYILLAQACLNDYDNYVKAEEKVLLANSFASQNDKNTADKIYREALQIQSINLDAIASLIELHKDDSDEELYSIAELTANNLKYYPLPMYDLLRFINGRINSPTYKSVMMLLEKQTLQEATKATSNNTLQYDVCKTMANYLLGNLNLDIASFTFDGEKGATLSLSSTFNNTNPHWDYSLDNGRTWKDIKDGNSVVLSNEDVDKITSQNDILVHFIGVNYDEKNLFRIDIKDSLGLPKTLYANDLENKFIDSTDIMEWKYNSKDNWTSFKNETPNLSGNKNIIVRMGATGLYLPSEEKEYTFTSNLEDLTKSYITIDNLSVESFSSETVRTGNDEKAIYAIDGNINKFWHTSRTSTTDERYIVIKLDKPRYISQMQYVPVQNYDYGVIKNGIISSSLDGENWEEFYTIEDLPKNNETKTFEFNEPVYTQYIKLKCTKSYDYLKNSSADWFLSIAMLNFYEDLSKTIPTASIEYSRNETTALPVTAKLVNASEDITIINNGGKDTYEFTKNGEFIFEFVNKAGNKGSIKAEVDWIVDYSFAFDNEDPYTIILGSKYDGISWEYSIDGGNTWIRKDTLIYKLSDEEISKLNEDNDLKIRIQDDEIINIDILKGTDLPENLYANDLENKILGAIDTMEWRILGQENWTSYKNSIPDLSGNKTVQVRIKPVGTTLGSNIKEFTFTDKGENDLSKVYIPIEHLSIAGFSTESPGELAIYAIDGRPDTKWHTSHSKDDERYIIIELDEPRYISQVQYVPFKDYLWGIMNEGIISTSVDGENWEEEYRISGLTNEYSTKTFTFNSKTYAKYIKIQCTASFDGDNSNKDVDYFFNAAMFNLFEDKLDTFKVDTRFIYNIEELTNKDVSVRIISTNSQIVITNNNGKDTYTFTKNGEFTFEFKDEYGNINSATAIVDWIDKDIPIGEIQYSIKENTSEAVIATLKTNEDVTITNNNGSDTYTFTKNGEFTFEFVDRAGNKGTAIAKVTWILEEEKTDEKDENKEDKYITSEIYKVEKEYISKVIPQTTFKAFKKNIKTNQDIVLCNKKGKILPEETKLATGMILKVGNIKQYTIVVRGDIDEDGEISANDLSKLKLHLIDKEKLKGANLKAANIDLDEEVMANDLSQMKLVLIGLLKLK